MNPIFARALSELDRAAAAIEEADAARSLLAAESESFRRRVLLKAIAADIEHAYTGIERAFLVVASDIDDSVPRGMGWHEQLCRQMYLALEGIRPAVLPPSTRSMIDELRGFRHRVRNLYGADLDQRKTLEKVPVAQAALEEVRAAMDALRRYFEERG